MSIYRFTILYMYCVNLSEILAHHRRSCQVLVPTVVDLRLVLLDVDLLLLEVESSGCLDVEDSLLLSVSG